jgi:hypothetical protein
MSLGTYDTHDLVRVIETLTPDVSNYWSQFFPNAMNFDQEFIDFDLVDHTRRLAPFVSPLVQGKVQTDRGYSSKRFKPAYIKPKDVIDPSKIIKRRAGEPLMGSLSLQQRRDAKVAEILSEHRKMIDRRLEWMAARAIIDGSLTITGESYPTAVVAFQRNANRTVVLTGTNLWTDTVNSDPLTNFETWLALIQSSTGYIVNRATMGVTAWQAFRVHPKVKDLLSTQIKGSALSVDRDPLNGTVARKVGEVSGVEIYVYADVYDADDGTVTQMLSQDTVVLTASAGIEGVRCFGAIMDGAAGYQPLTYFPKTWVQEDPSAEYLMTQSAPLMVPLRADCTMKVKVV